MVPDDNKNPLSHPNTSLEEPGEQRREMEKMVLGFGHDFVDTLENSNAFNVDGPNPSPVKGFEILEDPWELKELLEFFKQGVLNPGLNPASGGHLGYIPGGGLFSAALGDYLAALTNRYAGVHYASPGAVKMENSLIEWSGKLIGYTEGFGGNLTSGGSLANLIALACAKKSHGISSQNVDSNVIYWSAQTHHSLNKALHILGLEECILRIIPLDGQFKLSTRHLEEQVELDIRAGLHPFLVIANAGSTDVGAIDPIETLSIICKNKGMWLHVDAAYGGFFALTTLGKSKLKGLGQADSVILDPHKGLFLPYGSGIVLVKNIEQMVKTFRQEAHYMQDSYHSQGLSPADLSPELSKHFRGLRMWLPLKLYGPKVFSDYLEEKLELTRYLYRELLRLNFTVQTEPELTVIAFRYKIPGELEQNDRFNRAILNFVISDGRIFLSSTMIDNRFTLRAAILSFRTHKKEIDLLLELLKHALEESKVQGHTE